MKQESYAGKMRTCLSLKSENLPFVPKGSKAKDFEISNKRLQEFVRLLEKKTDTLWYMGSDFVENDFCERFMMHHGGFMEISLKGKIRIYFAGDKKEKFIRGLEYALGKMIGINRAVVLVRDVKVDKRLISLSDSLNMEER